MPPISLSAGRTAFTQEHPDLATDALIQLATLPDTHVLPPTPGEAVTPLSDAIDKVLSNAGAVGAVMAASAQQANAALATFWARIDQ
ncbi:MAG TPA: hypothetical protein VFK80_09025, partial [Limnochordia bacterium]|nr:hypothetical protein [Limnochordia bacterium]